MSKTFQDLINESIPSKKEETDDLGCLLCSIMEALGQPKHILKNYKPEKLPELFGGDAEVIITLGGPENAYEEDSFVDMMKDILGMISTEKEYKKEDIKELRKNKSKQGTSVKKLLAIMDDDHIEKAFKGLQIFKNGGELIEFDELGRKIRPERKIIEAISGEVVIMPEDLDKEMLEGKKLVKTSKGEGRFINKKFYFTKNLPLEAGGIKKDQDGDTIEEENEEVENNVTTPKKDGQIEIRIDGKVYNVWEAKTDEEKQKGLQGVESLEDNEGMIFYYDKPQPVDFWGKDTLIPLTIAFFDEDEECISVKRIEPMNEELVHEDRVMFVVELNVNADVKPGDELEFDEDEEYVMSVLGPDGQSQYELKSGQRIVSRKETVVLIKKAKKAYRNKNKPQYDSYCKQLGRYMFKVLDGQDNREPEYVELEKKGDNA